MSHDKRLTLTEYCDSFKVTVVERQPASSVPASYRGKPKDQQVMTGVKNIEEVLLSNGDSVFICVDDEHVFETAASATSHRSRNHRLPTREKAIEEHFEAMKEIGKLAEQERQITRGKKRKADNPEVVDVAEHNELQQLATEQELRIKQLINSAQEWRDMYDVLKGDFDLLHKAHDSLKRAYDELEAGIVSDVLRTRLRFMFTDALGEFFSKVENVVAHQANSNKELKTILES